MGSKNYFNPRLKRINPAYIAEKNKFNEVKQKSHAKRGDDVSHSNPKGDRKHP